MKSRVGTAVVASLLFACSAAPLEQPTMRSDEQALIAAIESRVAFPEGAGPLSRYARHYAYGPEGDVWAVYLVPMAPSATDDTGCEVLGPLRDDGIETRPCTRQEIDETRSMEQRIAARRGRAGRSYWLKDYRELPAISDGGCAVVELVFDPVRTAFERIECHGYG